MTFSSSQVLSSPASRSSLDDNKDLPFNGQDASASPELGLTAIDQTSIVKDQDAGVTKIEALYAVFGRGWKIWLLYLSIGLICYSFSLSSNTTYVYEPFATSAYGQHAIVGTISVVTSIMSGVAKPFIAKIADLASRPAAYTFSLVFYCIGFILVAASANVGTVVGGQLLHKLGSTGIDLLTTIILADITSLQWRGMANALAASPYIVNAFVAGYISEAVSLKNWRWGYGMFVIIVPVAMAPALVILFWADQKAKRLGALSRAYTPHQAKRRTLLETTMHWWSTIDGFGLILLGVGFSLILLPFTLYTSAKGGWKNPSLIAMFVVGGVLLITFMVWESLYAVHPIQPKSLLINRTFICCVVIDFMYYLSSYVADTYFTSWVYVVKDWSTRNYNFYINAVGVGLCVFSFIAAGIQRYTHRYKYMQLSGLGIRIIGQALKYYAAKSNPSDAVLVMAQLMCALGGSFSVIGSQVASQASVAHAFMAQAISLLALWTSVGGGIGSAISAAMWNNKLPHYLNEQLGDTLNSTQIAEIYGSIVVAKYAEPRAQVIVAYNKTMTDLLLPSLLLCFVPLIAGCFTTNFYLGTTHNAIEAKEIVLREESEVVEGTKR